MCKKKEKDLIQRLFALSAQRGMKLNLDRIQSLVNIFDQPQDSFSVIHVAGSNGKGSVATKLAFALKGSGYRVGLFTSPHIFDFKERFQVGGELISQKTLCALLEGIFCMMEEEKIEASFFEVTTLLAFLYFKQSSVDFAVIETGLGGRLDATNVVNPILSIITSISWDHQNILGFSLDEIAREKGGIIKQSIPVVLGPTANRKVLKDIAQKKQAPFFCVEGKYTTYDEENKAIARCSLGILEKQGIVINDHVETFLFKKPPLRFHFLDEKRLESMPFEGPHPCGFVVDVAHNQEGLKQLLACLDQTFPGAVKHFIVGFAKDKDLDANFRVLSKASCMTHLISHHHPRLAPLEQLEKAARQAHLKTFFSHRDIEKAVKLSWLSASKKGACLICCGSFFLMEEFKKAFHLFLGQPAAVLFS